MSETKQGPGLPPSGGAWQEDPETGELVRVGAVDVTAADAEPVAAPETPITDPPAEPAVASRKEKK